MTLPSLPRRHFSTGLLATGLPLPAVAQGRRGGDAVVAQQAEPQTLDAQASSEQATRNITLHIHESLFSRDEAGAPQPDLADGVDIAPDGLTWRFFLRRAVFHHGRPLTAADVQASMRRYAKLGGLADVLRPVAAYEAPDEKTFVMKLSAPFPGLLEAISGARAPFAVMPAEECGKPAGRAALIGTGPFRFVEHRTGSHVRLARFDGYTANPGFSRRDGLAGRKTAYFDSATFRFMPDEAARAAALAAGKIQVAEALDPTTARQLEAAGRIRAHPIMPWGFLVLVMNTAWGLTARPEFRRAVQAALGREEIIAAASGGYYRLNPAWQYPDSPYFSPATGSDAGAKPDEATARRRLRAAGYRGEEMNLLADDSCRMLREAAATAAEHLREAGINIKLIAADGPATLAAGRRPDGWNLWPLNLGIAAFDGPLTLLGCFGGRQPLQIRPDLVIEQCIGAIAAGPAAAVAGFQARLDDQAIAVKAGDTGIVQGSATGLVNFAPYRIPRLWDCWFA